MILQGLTPSFEIPPTLRPSGRDRNLSDKRSSYRAKAIRRIALTCGRERSWAGSYPIQPIPYRSNWRRTRSRAATLKSGTWRDWSREGAFIPTVN